jgi:hypothetical protein
MTHPSPNSDLTQAHIELALLQRLWGDDRAYPWNPEAPEAQIYFEELEAELDQLSNEPIWSDEEVTQRWQALSTTLDSIWTENTEPTVAQTSAASPNLQEMLCQQFANRMPQSLLQAIAHQAQQVVATGQPLAEQLVQCVQGILPNWEGDDLQVMARPLAYAMRGEADMLEVALRSIRFAAWTELSGVEKARLSLAIARYALAQLDHPNPAKA